MDLFNRAKVRRLEEELAALKSTITAHLEVEDPNDIKSSLTLSYNNAHDGFLTSKKISRRIVRELALSLEDRAEKLAFSYKDLFNDTSKPLDTRYHLLVLNTLYALAFELRSCVLGEG